VPLDSSGANRTPSLAILATLAGALSLERLAYLAAKSLVWNVSLGGIALRSHVPLRLNALSELLKLHAGPFDQCVGARWRYPLRRRDPS
jgi:hypothetical protein